MCAGLKEERARLSQGIPRDTWNRGGFFKVLGMCLGWCGVIVFEI